MVLSFSAIKSGISHSKCGRMAIASALIPDFELKSGSASAGKLQSACVSALDCRGSGQGHRLERMEAAGNGAFLHAAR